MKRGVPGHVMLSLTIVLMASAASGQLSGPADVYAAKFVCGEQPAGGPVAATIVKSESGHYSTVVNVLNPTTETVSFAKKVVPMMQPAHLGAENPNPPGKLHPATLPPGHGFFIDCADLRSLAGPPFTNGDFFFEGWIVLQNTQLTVPLNVSATYTTGPVAAAFSEKVPPAINVVDVHASRVVVSVIGQ